MQDELKKFVVDEFSGRNAQLLYNQQAEEGLWISESFFISKHFTNIQGKLLDLGCGTGRTTMPLHQKGYQIIGMDLVPAMIDSAKKIAKQRSLSVDYRVGDATQLPFPADSFDYAFFSNQGWTQIPGQANRLKALSETFRVLRPGGLFIFTAHCRNILAYSTLFWIKQWIRFYLLKPLGIRILEVDFGDRFFVRESSGENVPKTVQYIHIPKKELVYAQLQQAGFEILEVSGDYAKALGETRRYPPTFFVARKPSA
jgi:ubiquinone/menaquinone biosynthesis C-methylase UbiE